MGPKTLVGFLKEQLNAKPTFSDHVDCFFNQSGLPDTVQSCSVFDSDIKVFLTSPASGHSAAERGGTGQTAGGEQQTQRVPQLFVCEEPRGKS